MANQSRFNLGDRVRHNHHPEKIGTIIEIDLDQLSGNPFAVSIRILLDVPYQSPFGAIKCWDDTQDNFTKV
jgi:hypothetical protein